MIAQISVSWNEKYEHDGFLFFAQRIVEMLDYMTVDIYRAPLLNTSRLIDEYLRICHGAAKPYHLEEVYNEFSHSFKNDIVIQYKLGEDRIQQIVNRLNRFPDKRQQTMEYLCHAVADHYLTWTKEYIEHIVPQNNQKRKIERAIRCFISEDGHERKLVVNRGKYKSIEDDNPPKIGEMSEAVVTNLIRGARCSMPQLKKIVKLHNRAISSNGLENGFLNMWSIMEMICVSNPDGSKIEQVKSVAVPILKRDYLPVLFNDITDNLKRILEPDAYRSLIESITDGAKDYEKIACLILLPKYSEKLDIFVDCLVNYPVLRTRMLNLHDDCQTRNELNNLTDRYAQRTSWHLYRIYRARNSIVHSGKKPSDLKDLGEHLHAYVDSLVNEVIIKLSTDSLCHISNVLVDSELKQEVYDEYFKESMPIDADGIKLIFSQMESWTDC